MEIKSAEVILNKWYKPLHKSEIAQLCIEEAMKEYAAQFIDCAAEKATIKGFQMIGNKRVDFKEDGGVIFQGENYSYPEMEILINQESILKVKELIK